MFGSFGRTGCALSLAIFALGAVLWFGKSNNANAATLGGQCTVNTIAVKENDASFSTQSQEGVNIPGMVIDFTLASPGCVLAEFTAYATSVNTSNFSFVTFSLNNGQVGKKYLFADKISANDNDLLTVRAVFRNLPAGSHSLRMELESSDGQQVDVSKKLFLLHYKK